MSEKNTYSNITIITLENSEIEISGEISAESFLQYRSKALKKISGKTKIDGFRPGHIPESVLISRLSEQIILEEAAQMALSNVYPKIITEKKLSVIGHPNITLTKIAKDNPLGFKIKTAIIPDFVLPDYKKIAEGKMNTEEKIEVTNKELDDVIFEIRKTRYISEIRQHGGTVENQKDIKEEDLSPLSDDTIKTFGDFKTVIEFRERIKENLGKEKEFRAKEKRRILLSDTLIEKTSINLPSILIESELEKMVVQTKDEAKRMQVEYEEYLKQIKKTEADLRKEWRNTAKKRAKLQLIINEIAEIEKIKPEEEMVQQQVAHLLNHHKDAKEERVRIYVESLLTNELVFEFLEGQKEKRS